MLVRALATLYDEMRDQVTKAEFAELRDALRDLAQAQQRTDERLKQRVEHELVELRRHVDQRFALLADAQARTEHRVQELAAAQQRTEAAVASLTAAQERAYQEFSEFRTVVDQRFAELAAAQQRTEAAVGSLTAAQERAYQEFSEFRTVVDQRFAELAAAQQRTEAAVASLTAAQERAYQEFSEFRTVANQRFAELTAAQERAYQEYCEFRKATDLRFAALTAALEETQRSLKELTESHRQTQQELRQLTKQVQALVRDHRQTREMLANLSDTVGYGLEDRAISRLPKVLQRHFGLEVQGALERKWVEYPDGGADELNIFGTAVQNGQTVTVVGEAKARLGLEHLTQLEKRLQRLEKYGFVGANRFVFVVSYTVDPKVARAAANKNIVVIPSYWLGAPE